eukprot:532713-Alexandrium_andersonii.AAC.1
MPACLRACMLARLCACAPATARPRACMLAFLRACVPARLPARGLAHLCACAPASFHACVL